MKRCGLVVFLFVLFASEIAAGKEREGILRFKLYRQVQIGARQIEAAASLAQISAQQQGGDKLRIQLKRSLGVIQREIQFRTARMETRAIHIGFQSIVRRTRCIINHRGAGRLDLLGSRAIAVFQFARAGQPDVADSATISNNARSQPK